MQPQERLEEEAKNWYALGEVIGLDIVDDEEVDEAEQDDEDKEVEKIIKRGKEAKRKLATGT